MLSSTIQYCSDLHLEFKANEKYLQQNPLVPKAEILILAGDILPFKLIDKPCNFLDFVSDNFEITYWIPGNHEYYYYDLADVKTPLYEKIRKNVILLNNQIIEHENMELVFSTLWSHIPQLQEWVVQKSVNDFWVINNKGKKLTATDFNEMHQNDLDFLKNSLTNPTDKKRIVVTHHVPTFMNYPQHYKSSNINGAFASELHDFIENSEANYWIYGHHHCNISSFKIGKTTLFTNQLGYVENNEHRIFNPKAVIEI